MLRQVVQIHPKRGVLSPEESALCVLTFTSADYPTCYQLDVICQVPPTFKAALSCLWVVLFLFYARFILVQSRITS